MPEATASNEASIEVTSTTFKDGQLVHFNELAKKMGIYLPGDFRIEKAIYADEHEYQKIGHYQLLKLEGYPKIIGGNLVDLTPEPAKRPRSGYAPFGS